MSGKVFMENRLKRLLLCYSVSGLFFVAVLCGIIIAGKYDDSLSAALITLQKAHGNLIRLQVDIRDINKSLTEIKSMIGPDSGPDTPEVRILTRLDDLKLKMKGAEITIGDLEYKGDEMSLPVSIKSEMTSYTDLINETGYLQSMKFPFCSINAVSLSQSADKKAVSYEIKGILRMPVK